MSTNGAVSVRSVKDRRWIEPTGRIASLSSSSSSSLDGADLAGISLVDVDYVRREPEACDAVKLKIKPGTRPKYPRSHVSWGRFLSTSMARKRYSGDSSSRGLAQ